MKVFKDKEFWLSERKFLAGKTIGFVPTMGALHKGHLSLIEKSLSDNDITVVSIFLNPTQFDNASDLENYPKLLEQDIALLERSGVDYLFNPEYNYLYPDNYKYQILETELSNILCGASRPGHFKGVLTVVMKLFNIIKPKRAYFGEKDYQQLELIKGMVNAFFMDVEIVPCPIVRESDGLAMSSRNLRLTPSEREIAPKFYEILSSNLSDEAVIEELEKIGFRVDYITSINNRRYGAVYLGKVRLIDNVQK